MTITLYWISEKTEQWHIKVFWHLIDICKVNGWILYRRHCKKLGNKKLDVLQLRGFSVQLANSLIFANQPAQPGRPWKHRSIEEAPNRRKSKAVAGPTPGNDVWYDGVAYWPERVDKKITVGCARLMYKSNVKSANLTFAW